MSATVIEHSPPRKGEKSTINAEIDEGRLPPSLPISAVSDEAPEGGSRAWLVAAGGFALFFCCLGFSNSFGVFEEYYASHQMRGESPDKIAWIGSLSAFLQFAAGSVGGPLFDRFGEWVDSSVPHMMLAPVH